MPSRRRRTPLALAITILLLGVVAACSDDDASDVGTGDAPTSTTSTTPADSTSTSTSTTAVVDGPIDASTPLTALGIGPIRAGMTLREAEAASGLDLPHSEQDLEIFEGHCFNASVEGQPDLGMIVLPPGDEPVSDPLDGIVSSVYLRSPLDAGSPETRRTTDAGIGFGATEAEVEAAHPGAIEAEPHQYVPEGAYLYVFPPEHPGFGIRYVLDETRTVVGIDVGEERAIRLVENCA